MSKSKYTFTKVFSNNGTIYSGFSAASQFLKGKGFSLGALDPPHPSAVVKGKYIIPKWSKLLEVEKKAVDGVMESADFVRGDVVVKLKKEP